MIELKNVSVAFENKNKVVHALRDVSLKIKEKEIFGIVGYSGAGKSTLVRCINLLTRPDSGEVYIKGEDITKLTEKELRKKRMKIGMIFQHFNLFSTRTIFENVYYPLKHSKLKESERIKKVESLLKLVDIYEKRDDYPSKLSGGQRQRVAIARALANDPDILLCDESTSALDPQNTSQILKLLKKLNEDLGLTIVIITHEMQVVKSICTKCAVMENGNIVESKSVLEIFSNPEHKLTKEFIESTIQSEEVLETLKNNKDLVTSDNSKLVRLDYIGDSTLEPIILELYKKFNVVTSILWGNVEFIQNTPLGVLIVSLKGDCKNILEAFDYMKEKNVRVRELRLEEENEWIF